MLFQSQTLSRSLKRSKLLFAALAIGSGLSALAARAEDWPRFRGPNHDNISKETGLLKQWPAGGPKLLWKITGVGSGTSSVSIAAGRIYTMGDLAGKASLICLNAADGKQIWATPVGRGGGSDNSAGRPGTHCTPTVDGDRIYCLAQFGELACVSAADGKMIWSKDLLKDFGGAKGRWDYAESPIIDGQNLICTPGGSQGTMAALNKMTGEVVWRTKDWTDSAEYVTPTIAEIGGVRQYIQFTQRNVAGVSQAGKVLWLAPRAGRTAIASSPVYSDGIVFVASGYGVGCNAFQITQNAGQFKAEQLHASRDLASHHGGMVAHNGHVYAAADNGILMCWNPKTGQAAWKERLFKGSLVIADGMIYARSERGPLALVEATPEGFKPRGEFEQPDRSSAPAWPYPVVAHGRLYIRDQDLLLCYDVKAQ